MSKLRELWRSFFIKKEPVGDIVSWCGLDQAPVDSNSLDRHLEFLGAVRTFKAEWDDSADSWRYTAVLPNRQGEVTLWLNRFSADRHWDAHYMSHTDGFDAVIDLSTADDSPRLALQSLEIELSAWAWRLTKMVQP